MIATCDDTRGWYDHRMLTIIMDSSDTKYDTIVGHDGLSDIYYNPEILLDIRGTWDNEIKKLQKYSCIKWDLFPMNLTRVYQNRKFTDK